MDVSASESRLPRALLPFHSGQYRMLVGALMFSMLSVGIWLVASVWQVIALGGSPPISRSSRWGPVSGWCCRC